MRDLLSIGTSRGHSMIGTGIGLGLCGNYLPTARDIDPTVVLDLQFATTKSLTATKGPTPSFSRASTATYFDQNGILQTAAVNVPRFGYWYNWFASQWQIGGLVCEPQSTNYCTYSRDLTNAAWSKTNLTAAKDQTGLDGVANSCTSITATAANGEISFSNSQAFALTGLLWIKRISGSGVISISQDGGTTWYAHDDVSFKAPNGSLFIPSLMNVTGSNNYSSAYTVAAGSSLKIRIANSGDSFAIDGVNLCNVRAFYPINTNGSAVTRSSDICEINSASGLYNPETSIFTKYVSNLFNDGTSGYRATFCFSDGTSSNYIRFRAGARPQTTINSAGSSVLTSIGPTYANNTTKNHANRIKALDSADQDYIYSNNVYSSVRTNLPASLPASLNKFEIGCEQILTGSISSPTIIGALKIWNIGKTNTELTGIIAP